MFTIKQNPEDFVVEELFNLPADSGPYTYFRLTKRGLTTEKALAAIARHLSKPRKFFGYAGAKDKHAVTTQYCSLFGKIRNFSTSALSVIVTGSGKQPISLGDHDGNSFVIAVRNLDSNDLKSFHHNHLSLQSNNVHFPNLFDTQRFSSNNAEIGKAIVQKHFAKATSLLCSHSGDYEKIAASHLAQHANDHAGALRTLPPKILQLYVHAYQSRLWNELAQELSEIMTANVSLPLPGFASEIRDANIKAAVEKLLQREHITLRDFIIRELPGLSMEGSERQLYATAKNFLTSSPQDDELNSGRKKIILAFSLPKGSYATMVVKQLFRPMLRH